MTWKQRSKLKPNWRISPQKPTKLRKEHVPERAKQPKKIFATSREWLICEDGNNRVEQKGMSKKKTKMKNGDKVETCRFSFSSISSQFLLYLSSRRFHSYTKVIIVGENRETNSINSCHENKSHGETICKRKELPSRRRKTCFGRFNASLNDYKV